VVQSLPCERCNETSGFIKDGGFIDCLNYHQFIKEFMELARLIGFVFSDNKQSCSRSPTETTKSIPVFRDVEQGP
jgi:hypothetical protein